MVALTAFASQTSLSISYECQMIRGCAERSEAGQTSPHRKGARETASHTPGSHTRHFIASPFKFRKNTTRKNRSKWKKSIKKFAQVFFYSLVVVGYRSTPSVPVDSALSTTPVGGLRRQLTTRTNTSVTITLVKNVVSIHVFKLSINSHAKPDNRTSP